MTTPLYRKTEAGHTEVRERRAGLDSRSRSLLILCNGRLDEGALAAHLRGPVADLLRDLVARGLLEAAPVQPKAAERPAAVVLPSPAPLRQALAAAPMAMLWRIAAPLRQIVAPKPVPTTQAPPDTLAMDAGLPDTLPDIVRRGWQLLEPLFGPGSAERMAPIERAGSGAELRRALDELRDALAIYRGRKAAADLVRRIELG